MSIAKKIAVTVAALGIVLGTGSGASAQGIDLLGSLPVVGGLLGGGGGSTDDDE